MLNFAFMANKLKSSNPSKKSGASKLAAEKLETVEVKKLDEVTGIEGIEYQKRFVPGLDFLGAAGLGAGILAACSFIIRGKPNHN